MIGLISVCAWCPDAHARSVAARATGAQVTHGLCPTCAARLQSQDSGPSFTEADARALRQLAIDTAIVHAHTDAERAICRGEWPFVCPYCSESFQTADRWFPFCGGICAVNADLDR